MSLQTRIKSFAILGKFLGQYDTVSFREDPGLKEINSRFSEIFARAMREAEIYNPWFTREFMHSAFSGLANVLQEDSISVYVKGYPGIPETAGNGRNIGLIMAGNIPLVGFHDILDVCLSGHRAQIKMSSRDEKLLPVIHDILCYINPEFLDSLVLVKNTLDKPDAVIATGSDNSSRYFEFYFGKYPHIIRKNRNSAAVLTGDETREDFRNLADDIFLYFGMGCRNVSKLYLPVGFNIPGMLDNFESYSYLYNHNKYANNYDYHKAIFLVNRAVHLDTGFLLLREDQGYSSPVGVVFYEYYDSLSRLRTRLDSDSSKIQCIAALPGIVEGSVRFGHTQRPGLTDFADGTDTMKFLLNLYKK